MKALLVHLLPLSREGLLWFLLSFAMLVTGLLKGINLITLLACWMVTLVLLNYCWAYPQLRFLKAKRLFPDAAFAGSPFSLLIQVDNPASRIAYGITVRDAGPDHRAIRFLPSLAAHASATLLLSLELPRRGRYRLEPIELSTGYPLALVHLTKPTGEPDDLIIYPSLGELKRGSLRRFLSQQSPTLGQARVFPRRHPGAQTEFHGLRPLRAGDSPRWIHWRTTARRGELMIREFEDMPSDHLVLIVDPGFHQNALLERVLSLAATICWVWCRQKGDRLALAVAEKCPTVLVGTTGDACAALMLERLAIVQPRTEEGDAALLEALLEAELPPGPILVVSVSASPLPADIGQVLRRSVAHLDLARAEDKEFFDAFARAPA